MDTLDSANLNEKDVTVSFSCNACLPKDCVLCIAGDVLELGFFSPDKAITLLPNDSDNESIDSNRNWTVNISMKNPSRIIKYSYFVIKSMEGVHFKVLSYESFPYKRSFCMEDNAADTITLNVDMYGMNGELSLLRRGWLTRCSGIFVTLPPNSFTMHCKRKKSLLISFSVLGHACTTSDMDHDCVNSSSSSLGCDSLEFPKSIDFVNLNFPGDCTFRKHISPLSIHEDDYIVFRCEDCNPDTTQFLVQFFTLSDTNAAHVLVGHAVITRVSDSHSVIEQACPILDRSLCCIGSLTARLLVVKPCSSFDQTLEFTYSDFSRRKRPVIAGHRGAGFSHGENLKKSNIRENSMAAFKAASLQGLDMIEFDVQLSKDHVPVIYHEYRVNVGVKVKHDDDLVMCSAAVRDFNLNELKTLRFHHVHDTVDSEFMEIVEDDWQPFPTLISVMQQLPESLAFNVELKYPQKLENGFLEENNFFDRQMFVDTILTSITSVSSERRIMFSSFDPDTCIMLSLKQNRYPVFFLTCGETDRFMVYKEWRGSSLQNSINFARAFEFAGLSVFTDELVKRPEIINKIIDSDLALFCWGEETNDPKHRATLIDRKVDGIICDDIFLKDEFLEVGADSAEALKMKFM